MIIQPNQTTYKCYHCGRRFLSKNGAKLHEEEYCKSQDSPNHKSIMKRRKNCEHKRVETQYTYIPGEAVKEPDHDLCLDCGARL